MKKYGRTWERLNWESNIETNPKEWWYALRIGDDIIMEENQIGLFILIDADGLMWASYF